MSMTPEAKSLLSKTIRDLRTTLLDDLQGATEGTYRLALPAAQAGLDEAAAQRRKRLESWAFEQAKANGHTGKKRDARAFIADAVKLAAATLLNRHIVVRILEASDPRRPKVLTGGWKSPGYKDFRDVAPALLGDESEGLECLLGLIFEDLAVELPGLFGPAGIAALIPVPVSTLRSLIDALDAPELASCWTDPLTLGWIYQYWNDPEREALDEKLNGGGKVEPHEIASKTQMFTERYMVDWLLQNSLGPIWFEICERNAWVPEVVADGTLARLEARRIGVAGEA
jgi:hypothetical protein